MQRSDREIDRSRNRRVGLRLRRRRGRSSGKILKRGPFYTRDLYSETLKEERRGRRRVEESVLCSCGSGIHLLPSSLYVYFPVIPSAHRFFQPATRANMSFCQALVEIYHVSGFLFCFLYSLAGNWILSDTMPRDLPDWTTQIIGF